MKHHDTTPPWKKEDIYAQYLYGSRLYGTNGPDSDWDFITILKNWNGRHEQFHTFEFGMSGKAEKHSFSTHGIESFQKALDANEIWALECINAPDMYPANKLRVNPEVPWKYRFNRKTIKENADARIAADFKRFEQRKMEGNLDEARKALFHGLRTNDFADQLHKFGKIIDFGSSNELWLQIATIPDDEFVVEDFSSAQEK